LRLSLAAAFRPSADFSDWNNEDCDSVRICTDLMGDELLAIAFGIIEFVAVQRDPKDIIASLTATL